MTMGQEVLYEELGDGVVLVTLNRPEKLNAINAALAQGLAAAVKRSEDDPAVRVVILTSSVERIFSAGADLAAAIAGEGPAMYTPDGGFAGITEAKRRKPWIAAVRGKVLGGGFELVLSCDMIVASEDATFALPEPKRGVLASAGGAIRLPLVIPRHVAKEMIVTGEPIDAARGYALGLVNRVVSAAELLPTAQALARQIASNAPIAVQEALALAHAAEWMDEETALKRTAEAQARMEQTEDYAEGPRAFLEKRAPVWKGR